MADRRNSRASGRQGVGKGFLQGGGSARQDFKMPNNSADGLP